MTQFAEVHCTPKVLAEYLIFEKLIPDMRLVPCCGVVSQT